MNCSKCRELFDVLTENGLCPDCRIDEEERKCEIVALAQECLQEEGKLEIDDAAEVSEGNDNGCYVGCWAWLDFSGTKFDKERKDQPHAKV